MDEQPQPQSQSQSNGYGKRPLWQWVVLYLVIGAVIYGLVYYFVFAKKGSYNYGSSNNSQQQYSQQQTSNNTPASTQPQAMTVENSLVLTRQDPTKGNFLTDTKGMTLYIFDKDTTGKSNCSGTCLVNWPIFTAPSATLANLPENFGVVQSTNGKYMYTYKNMPLYYYINDKQPGDTTGDGVGGVWHLAKP